MATVVVVMGVAGSGKSSIGQALAHEHSWDFADADAFHPSRNVELMRAGIALSDDDRRPWLDAITAWIRHRCADGVSSVLACSALKRSYRDALRSGSDAVRFVFLDASRELISRRLADRPDHFFPAALLESQFDDLEPPSPDEGALIVDAALAPVVIVQAVDAWLQQQTVRRPRVG